MKERMDAQYKRKWYLDNRKRLLAEGRARYREDPVYRKDCIKRARASRLRQKKLAAKKAASG